MINPWLLILIIVVLLSCRALMNIRDRFDELKQFRDYDSGFLRRVMNRVVIFLEKRAALRRNSALGRDSIFAKHQEYILVAAGFLSIAEQERFYLSQDILTLSGILAGILSTSFLSPEAAALNAVGFGLMGYCLPPLWLLAVAAYRRRKALVEFSMIYHLAESGLVHFSNLNSFLQLANRVCSTDKSSLKYSFTKARQKISAGYTDYEVTKELNADLNKTLGLVPSASEEQGGSQESEFNKFGHLAERLVQKSFSLRLKVMIYSFILTCVVSLLALIKMVL